MAAYVPDAEGIPADELIELLGWELAERFTDAENVMLAEVARRARRIIMLEADAEAADAVARLRISQELSMERARAYRDLQDLARQVVRDIREQDLAEWLIDIAAKEGEAGAAARLQLARRIPGRTFPGTSVQAVGALTLDLSSRLEALEQRILRFPQDVYQQVISETAPRVLLGAENYVLNQRQAVQRFLDRGVTAFVDRSDRRWTIGAYAEMAGRTATARAWNDAGVWRMQQVGLNLVTVQGGYDACRKCAPWIGKILSTDGTTGTIILPHATQDRAVTITIHGTVEEARAAGWNHPNCFPSFVPVGAPTGVVGADSRWFEGEVIVIHTAAGRELTVTPNHPVLTTEGWVAAGALVEGHDLISYRGDVERPMTSHPDHEGVESPIGEVFEALRQSGHVTSVTVPGAAEQFHGDGSADAEVEVVFADGLLRSDGQPTLLDLPAESDLLLGRVRESDLLAVGAALEVFHAAGHPANGVVSASGKTGSLLGAGLSHSRVHGSGLSADLDTGVPETTVDRVGGDTVLASEFLGALTGLVSTDQIVGVDRDSFAGHVYNLQTSGGWFTAQSIIVHNCRDRLTAYLPGLSVPQADFEYNEAAEKERERHRELERDVRAAKRREATAMDDIALRRARRDVADAQAELREFTRTTGRKRQSYREQLHFADGRS